MKQLVLLLLCVSVCSCVRIIPPHADREQNYSKYKLKEMDFSCNEVYVKDTDASLYKIDKQVLQNVISHSQKQYFLLYSFRLNCSNEDCLFYDTVIRQFYEHNDVALLLVSAESPLYKSSIEDCFANYINYGYPVFMIDPYHYGREQYLLPDYRFISFLSDINPSTKLEESSNSFLLFDKNMKVLVEGNYNSGTKQQIMNLIK